MSVLSLTLSQVRYVNKSFWRNPSSAFFTFAFPLMFLIIFTALLGNSNVHLGAQTIKTSTYYVASMAGFAVITACYNNVAINVAMQRDSGVLKRINATPLPTISFLAARVLHALLMACLLVAITAAFGSAFYDAHLPSGVTLLKFVVTVAVGAASFSALALAVTSVVPNADAAAPIVNATILPLLFLSGIFIAFDNNTPNWILQVARIFPVRHFALGMQAGFLGTPFHWTDVLIVVLWGIAGLVFAARHFTWEPRAN
jgi:ABC-2 type transport system permease protein